MINKPSRGERGWLVMVAMVILIIGIQLGIGQGRKLQLEEDLITQWVNMPELEHGTRWVVTSRETFPFLPGAEVFTVQNYVWRTCTLYITVYGDTITSAVIVQPGRINDDGNP